jgi:hypothetical protein
MMKLALAYINRPIRILIKNYLNPCEFNDA